MPIKIRKRKNKWIVTDDIKIFGTHTTQAKAAKQIKAINISEKNRKK
jgi:hypothetical protein